MAQFAEDACTRDADSSEKSNAVYAQYKNWVEFDAVKQAVTHKTLRVRLTDRQADDLKARLKVAERGTLGHPERLTTRHDRLKHGSSDTARREKSTTMPHWHAQRSMSRETNSLP